MGTRRTFLQAAGFSLLAGRARGSAERIVSGQGDFRYRLVPGWGVLDEKTPVGNCHGMVTTSSGHLVLLTDDVTNNVIIYEASGKLVNKWGTQFPGAHGLSLVREGGREVLFLTCLKTNRVVKATLDGEILQEWGWPEKSGLYENAAAYRPSWTLHDNNGDFFILDGYGKDYIQHIRADGSPAGLFGGAEGGIKHRGPHGGIMDMWREGEPTLLIAMSDQQQLLRLSRKGDILQEIPMPGGNPRQIRRSGRHWFVAHLADNWPADRESRGFVSVLDGDFRVVSNIGAGAAVYDDAGKLGRMKSEGGVFRHPHDLTLDADGNLYVAQFNSGNTYPLKCERV
jgi:hypothetical protein